MNEDEYEDFLQYLFHTYIRDRLHHLERSMEGPKGFNRVNNTLDSLRGAAHLLRYIQSHCADTDDIYSTFTTGRLHRVINEVLYGLRDSRRLAEEGGFLKAIDEHYDDIVSGIKFEHFPESELVVLRNLGSDDPKAEIQAIIYILKEKQTRPQNRETQSVSSRLQQSEKQLASAAETMEEAQKASDSKIKVPKKSKPWFKGLGKIAQGAALSLADIGLAVGMLHFPVSAETQTYGALVSAITGFGMIMNGTGELRGE